MYNIQQEKVKLKQATLSARIKGQIPFLVKM